MRVFSNTFIILTSLVVIVLTDISVSRLDLLSLRLLVDLNRENCFSRLSFIY